MNHRVLDERLEREGRDRHVERAVLRPELDAQPVSETDPLQVDVALHEIPLARERHEVRAALMHPLPELEEIPESFQRAFGFRGIAPHEPEERVERVQDEVGMELRAEEVELRFRAQDLGARGSVLGVAHFLGRLPGVSNAGERRMDKCVDDGLPDDDRSRRPLRAFGGEESAVEGHEQEPAAGGCRRDGENAQHEAGALARTAAGFPEPAAGEAERDGAEERARQDERDRAADRLSEGHAARGEEGRVDAAEQEPGPGVRGPEREARRAGSPRGLSHGSDRILPAPRPGRKGLGRVRGRRSDDLVTGRGLEGESRIGRGALELSGRALAAAGGAYEAHIEIGYPPRRIPMAKSRREFLTRAAAGLLGAGAAAKAAAGAPGPEPQTTPVAGTPPAFGTAPPVGPEVTAATFAEAEKLVRVEMTAAERAQAAGNWRQSMAADDGAAHGAEEGRPRARRSPRRRSGIRGSRACPPARRATGSSGARGPRPAPERGRGHRLRPGLGPLALDRSRGR